MTRSIKGWHVAAMFVAAFTVIIAVNLTLAFKAVGTFPGLETRNSYVASQSFERDRAAQDALGWDVSARVEEGVLTLAFATGAGPVRPEITSATFGRATHVADDFSPAFAWDGAAYRAELPAIAPGNWNLRLTATAADGTQFRRRIVVRMPR